MGFKDEQVSFVFLIDLNLTLCKRLFLYLHCVTEMVVYIVNMIQILKNCYCSSVVW